MNPAVTSPQMIEVAALRVGMFIHLDGGWLAHPFPLSSFKLASSEQITKILSLGIERVRWSPAQSDMAPAAPAAAPAIATTSSAPTAAEAAEAAAARQRRADLALQRERLRVCEQQFAEATRAAKQIFRCVDAQPQAAAAQANALTCALVVKMLGERELCIRLLNDGSGDKLAAHAVNVGIVALLMGRTLGLGGAELHDLGLGALLHDIGKTRIAPRLQHRDEQFTSAESRAYESHVAAGVAAAQRMGLNEAASMVIAQHHEHADGSGFPQRIGSERMSVAARIVAVVDRYDRLCNPALGLRANTPHEAVALLFAQSQHRFDSALLGAFIRMIGVYPPGSAVQLTDSRFALVIGVNSSRPLKPRVMVHEPGVPRDEALIVDLERQPGLGVLRSIKPAALPPKSFEYLAPPPRISYFFEPQAEAA